MKFEPYPYQQKAIDFARDHTNAGLLLDMGLGKTVITLTVLDELLYDRFESEHVLIIAPLQPAKNVWPQEIIKWEHTKHMPCSVAIGTASERKAAIDKHAAVTIINVDNVGWLVDNYGKHWHFDTVVVDELSCFKSPKSQRFRKLRSIRKHVKRLIGLTGTPAPNGLIDMWSQAFLIDFGDALGKTAGGYRARYFKPTQYANGYPVKWKPRDGAEMAIYDRLSSCCLSMQTCDHLDLPDRLDIIQTVTLPQSIMDTYRKFEKELLLPLDGEVVTAANAAVLAGKLLQFTGGKVYGDDGNVLHAHDEKLVMMDEILAESNGQPVLCFYGYKHELARLTERFPQAVNVKEDGAVERWNRGEIELLLAHPASAGHGLNLQTGGHIAVWYSLPWSLELYQQANKRLHRMGQEHVVLIHHLIAKGTIDERIMRVLSEKDKTQLNLIEALKGYDE
ncbi:MAG: DEAD/DEAH box helicase [Oscillospiraceae bacterium]|jgi:SNF2 family DNA or RNA helicase|nr:DEAD/DEAH box helicase [Oscillospiraceae bacterium]